MEASMDELSIEIESTTKDSAQAIDLLIARLDKLRVSLQNVVKESGNFSQLKNNLENISKGVSSRVKSPQLSSSFGAYGSKEQQLRQLGVIGDLSDSSYARLTSRIKTTNSELSKYVLQNNKVLTISEKVKNGQNDVKVAIKEVGDEANKSGNKWEKLKNAFTSVGAKLTGLYLVLRQVTNKVADFIKESANYQEALNLFMVTMGSNAEDAYKWVTKFSNALYLDPSNVMQYMGSFNSLTKGLGVGADRAYLMSKNLTQLTYDLASFKNLDFDTAFRKLQSAMSGEIEPLRNVGVALSQATLEQLAYSLGIEKNVADMTEAEKAQLRYIQIMKSSTEWQTDMGRTLVTPANALRVIKQQFTLLARAIGNVFIPVLMAAIPYIIAITKSLTALAQRLAELLGFQLADIDYSRITSGLGGIGDGIEDIGDEAGKTADKLNTMLAPFDELNVVQQESKKNGKSYGEDIFASLDFALPEYDALAGLTDKFAKKVGEAEKNLKNLLPVIEGIGIAFAGWKIAGGAVKVLSFLSDLKTGKSGLGAIAKGLGISSGAATGIIAGVTTTLVSLGIEIPKVMSAFDKFKKSGSLESLSGHFSTFDQVLLGLLSTMNILGQSGLIITLQEGFKSLAKSDITKIGNVVDRVGNSISDISKQKLTPIVKEFDNLDRKIMNLDFGNKIITNKDVTNIQNTLHKISESIINELDADKNEQLKNIKSLEKALGIDKTNELLGKVEEYYNGEKRIVETNTKKINEIMAKASNENRQLTQDEVKEISTLRGEMYETGIKAATENSDEYYKIMAKLNDNVTKLAVEQGSKIIKEAVKTKDKTIKAAEDQYNTTVAEAMKMKEAGIINDEEYDKIVKAAEKTKKETTKSANEQYEKIYKTVQEKLGDTSRHIDKKTGEIKQNWQLFLEDVGLFALNTWNDIKKGAGDKWDDIKNTITDKWKEAQDRFSSHIGNKDWWKQKFDGILQGAQAVLNDLTSKFNNWTAYIKTPHISWDSNGWKATGVVKDILKTLNLPTTLPKLSVSWYAEGGFPKDGEFFFANEEGPEMIGKIGNKSAVANNDQITQSITNALITALNSYDFGGNKGPTTIYIGNKKVYEGYGEYANSENDRYGTNTIRI